MKLNFKILKLILPVLVLVAFHGFSQSIVNVRISSLEKPFIVLKGQHLSISCDTAYIISPKRFYLYERARNSILSTDFEKSGHLFDSYNEQIHTYKLWNDTLQLKYNDLNVLFKNSLENTKKGLNLINNDLSVAKDSLNSAHKHLDQALLHLKAANREKWYFGTVGFLLGSLITILIVSK
jgi:hypothetical protein